MLTSRIVLIVFVFALAPFFPDQADARSRDREPENEEFTVDKKAGRYYSSRLGSQTTVFDAGPFRIITSKKYEKEVRAEVVPQVVAAAAEYRSFFGIEGEVPLWKGEGPCTLVLLEKRSAYRKYVSIFKKEADPDRLSPGFAAAVQETQSFYWIEPTPYAVVCGQGTGFFEVKQHIFHLFGHILVTCHDYNFKFMPPWLHEGFGIRTAVRYAGGNILYCRQGLNNALFGTGVFAHLTAWARSENWPAFILRESRMKGGISLARLIALPLEEYEHKDAALACSLVSFLIEKYPKELAAFIAAMKKIRGSSDASSNWIPAEEATKAFVAALARGTAELESEWKEWIGAGTEDSPEKGNGTARTIPEKASKNSAVRFDPGLHLQEFSRFEGEEEIAADLAPFVERTGQYMTPEMIEKTRAAWAETRARLIAAGAGRTFHVVVPPGLEKALAGRAAASDSAYLADEEVLGLIEYIPSPGCFRPAIGFLVKKHGCARAFALLAERFDGDLAPLAGTDVADDVAALEKAAAFEDRLFEGLAGAHAALKLDLYSARLKLVEVAGEELVLRARKVKSAKFTPPPGVAGCTLDERAAEVEIRCPRTCVSLDVLLKQSKNVLKLKSDEDRLGYCRICLFHGAGVAFNKELRVVKGADAEKATLKGLLGSYLDAQNGADLLTLLGGAVSHEPGDRTGRLSILLTAARDSAIYPRIEERMKNIIRRLVIDNCLAGKRSVPGLEGFKAMEEDGVTARFEYEFDDSAELASFDFDAPAAMRTIRHRYSKVDKSIVVDPPRIGAGCLELGGGAFLSHRGVFTGDIEVSLRLKVSRRDRDAAGAFYYILFGYGLDASGAYVGSSGLTHLDVQMGNFRDFKHLAVCEGERNAETEEGSTITLRGLKDRIVHTFNGEDEFSVDAKGQRTGRVFLWTYGARLFTVDRITIRAALDPDWLKRAVEAAVMEEFRRLLS